MAVTGHAQSFILALALPQIQTWYVKVIALLAIQHAPIDSVILQKFALLASTWIIQQLQVLQVILEHVYLLPLVHCLVLRDNFLFQVPFDLRCQLVQQINHLPKI